MRCVYSMCYEWMSPSFALGLGAVSPDSRLPSGAGSHETDPAQNAEDLARGSSLLEASRGSVPLQSSNLDSDGFGGGDHALAACSHPAHFSFPFNRKASYYWIRGTALAAFLLTLLKMFCCKGTGSLGALKPNCKADGQLESSQAFGSPCQQLAQRPVFRCFQPFPL